MSNDEPNQSERSAGSLPPEHPYSVASERQMAAYAERLAAGEEQLYGTPLAAPVRQKFDRFVAIDWSGARGLVLPGIAVASCVPGDATPVLVGPPGRGWSRERVLGWLEEIAVAGERALIGLDLSPGLPFKDAGSYFPGWDRSPANMPKLWELVDTLSTGDAHLGADGFIDAAAAHYRRPGQRGAQYTDSRGRLRACEKRQLDMRLSPSSCFNLVGAAQVGKSSLTGMRVLHRLGSSIPLWPYSPLPLTGPVLVEVYTSLAARAAQIPPGRAKMTNADALNVALHALNSEQSGLSGALADHATDAILTAAWLRRHADDPSLWAPNGLDSQVAQTEGWTFGVP